MTEHEQKYGALASKLGVSVAFPFLNRTGNEWVELLSGDPHLNNVPLVEWDRLSFSLKREMLSSGESWSMAKGVCVYKHAVREAVRNFKPAFK